MSSLYRNLWLDLSRILSGELPSQAIRQIAQAVRSQPSRSSDSPSHRLRPRVAPGHDGKRRFDASLGPVSAKAGTRPNGIKYLLARFGGTGYAPSTRLPIYWDPGSERRWALTRFTRPLEWRSFLPTTVAPWQESALLVPLAAGGGNSTGGCSFEPESGLVMTSENHPVEVFNYGSEAFFR